MPNAPGTATRPVPLAMLGGRRIPSPVPVGSPWGQYAGGHSGATLLLPGGYQYPVSYSRPLVAWGGPPPGRVPRRFESGIGAKSSVKTYGWPWSFQTLRISPPVPRQSFLYGRMVNAQYVASKHSYTARRAGNAQIPAPRVPLTLRTFGKVVFPFWQ